MPSGFFPESFRPPPGHSPSVQTTTDNRVPAVSLAARRLLSLVPVSGEPPPMALEEIAAGIGTLSDYELNAVLTAIGAAVQAARETPGQPRRPRERPHLERPAGEPAPPPPV
jgi:hypothetical protein